MAFNPFLSGGEGNAASYNKHLTAGRSPHSSRDSSPVPERLAALQQDSPKRGPSPCLPLKTLEELESEEFRRKEGNGDPDDPPLRSPWTFWFERAPAGPSDDYSQALKNIYTVRTIKQFFSVYNNLRPPSTLQPKECYHLMRDNTKEDKPRKPLWEDPDNLNGGIWAFRCRKDMSVDVWLELLLAAIGEQFMDSTAEDDDVVGVSIKIRERDHDTFQIWNENATHHGSSKVVDRIRTIVPFMEIRDCFYSSIKDKLSGNRTFNPAPVSHYRESPPPSTVPPISSNPQHSSSLTSYSSYRQLVPPRGGGGARKGPDGFYRYPFPRHPHQSSGGAGHRFPSSFGNPQASTSQFS